MKIIIKEPGQRPRATEIENSLSALQQAVGGYIETLTFTEDCCIICNEEGRLQGLPYNLTFGGIPFVGTILFVGVAGDEFVDLSECQVRTIMKCMEEK